MTLKITLPSPREVDIITAEMRHNLDAMRKRIILETIKQAEREIDSAMVSIRARATETVVERMKGLAARVSLELGATYDEAQDLVSHEVTLTINEPKPALVVDNGADEDSTAA